MTAGPVSQATGTVPGVPGGDPVGGLIIEQFTSDGGPGQQRDAAPGDGALRIPLLAPGKLLTVPDGNGLYLACHDAGACDLSTRQVVPDTFLAGTLRRCHREWVFSGMTAGKAFPASAGHCFALAAADESDQNIWPVRSR